MTLRRLLVLPLLLMAALLVGCGSDDSDESTTSSGSERGAERQNTREDERADAVGTDDFTFIPPDGWVDNSDALPNSEIAYINSEDRFPNINVIRTPGPKMSITEFEDLAVAELEGAGFANVTIQDPYEVDGIESPVVTAEAVVEGISYQTRQYYAQYEGAYYIITISLAPDATKASTVRISEDLIDSWRWES